MATFGLRTAPRGAGSKGPRRRRRARDLHKLPRSAALSQLYLAAETVARPNYPPESFFAPSALWAWVRNYLAYIFGKKHDFPPYTASPQSAIYDLLDQKGTDGVRIALVGDWGTGTDEAESVAEQMKKFSPHFTIHIGQQTSFSCLQNSHWRIIAVDTGYNSTGVPILGQIPIVNKIPGVGPDCRLCAELMNWLVAVVLQQADTRGLVIMSHHQYYSGFEDRFPKPAQQLWDAGIRRPVLWFWGHEHRLAGYDLYGSDDLQAFGRCVGHGGMPLSLWIPGRQPSPIFYDSRKGASGYGVNGHVNLLYTGPNLTATYIDLDGTEILRETWSVDPSGAVQFGSRTKLISDPGFHA